jgi:hypothetical protein
MTHGRDHEEREQKYPRVNHTSETEESLLDNGRHRGTPRQHLYGANEGRVGSAAGADETEPMADGSQVAPTRQAEERERERHRAERKLGRMAAGIEENRRDRREPEVTRGALEEAAREADRKVKPSR